MTIKITGAGGFIGQCLLELCQSQGIEAIGYSRSNYRQTKGLVPISDYTKIPDGGVLVHLAEENVISELTPEKCNQQVQMAERLSEKQFSKYIYASSATVYANHLGMISRNCKIYSDSLYAQSKIRCEGFFSGPSHVVVRLSNVYGPRMSTKSLISAVLEQRNNRVISVQTLSAIRDYIWVEDVARAFVKLAQGDGVGLFHLSTGIGVSVEDLIRQICLISGNLEFEINERVPDQLKSCLVIDPSETIELLSWRPAVTLAEGLGKLIREC